MMRMETSFAYCNSSYIGTVLILAVCMISGLCLVNIIGGKRMKTLLELDQLIQNTTKNETDTDDAELVEKLEEYVYRPPEKYTRHRTLLRKVDQSPSSVLLVSTESYKNLSDPVRTNQAPYTKAALRSTIDSKAVSTERNSSETNKSARNEVEEEEVAKKKKIAARQASANGAFFASMIGAILFTGSVYGVVAMTMNQVDFFLGTIILYPFATVTCVVLIFHDMGIFSSDGFLGSVLNFFGYIGGAVIKIAVGIVILFFTNIVYSYYVSVKYPLE